MASVDWEAVAGGVVKINIKIVTKIYGKTPAMDSFLRKKNSMTSNILWIFWHFSDSYAIEHWRTPAACNFIKKISRLAFSCEFCYTIEHVCSKRPGDRFCFFGFAFCFCSLCFTWIDINRFFTHQKTAPKNVLEATCLKVSECTLFSLFINPLSGNPTKWSNTLDKFVGKSQRIVWVWLNILWGWRLKG